MQVSCMDITPIIPLDEGGKAGIKTNAFFARLILF
jgi:hypothetical protein